MYFVRATERNSQGKNPRHRRRNQRRFLRKAGLAILSKLSSVHPVLRFLTKRYCDADRVEKVTVGFENCESVELLYGDFRFFHTGEISSRYRSFLNSCRKEKWVNSFTLGVDSEAKDSSRRPFAKSELRSRLRLGDITSFEVQTQDGCTERLLVDWPSSQDYCCPEICWTEDDQGNILVYLETPEEPKRIEIEDLKKFGNYD